MSKQFLNSVRPLGVNELANITLIASKDVEQWCRKHAKTYVRNTGNVHVSDAIAFVLTLPNADCNMSARLPAHVIEEARIDCDRLHTKREAYYNRAVGTVLRMVKGDFLDYSSPAPLAGGVKIRFTRFNLRFKQCLQLLSMACDCSVSDCMAWALIIFGDN